MRRLATVVLVGVGLAFCAKTPAVPEATLHAERWDEGENVLSLLRGATIRDRSGELSLEFASLLAIDSHPGSSWACPPEDLEEWLIGQLPTLATIDEVGVSLGRYNETPAFPKHVRFESSLDGEDWIELGTFEFRLVRGIQVQKVDPTRSRFVRVTTLDNHGNPLMFQLPTILVRGQELTEWKRPSVDGQWMLNDLQARLKQDGERVHGRVELDPPMLLEGAWFGRVVRFAWVRGRTYGVGFLAVNPEGNSLNGLWWYEYLLDPENPLGTTWYGSRKGEAGEIVTSVPEIAQVHIERAGRFPLYGLVFDDQGSFVTGESMAAIQFIAKAIASFPEFRIHMDVIELNSPDSVKNLERSQRMAETLLAGLAASGLPMDRCVIEAVGDRRIDSTRNAPLHRMMNSRVELSFVPIE